MGLVQDLGRSIDLHCHGGGGFYFSDPNPLNIEAAITFHKNNGTSDLLASLVTTSIPKLKSQIRQLIPFFNSGSIAGIHLEGPYVSQIRCGAHNPLLVKSPTIKELIELIDAGNGAIKMITFAPELDGALEAITFAAKNEIITAIGHSDGGYDDALKAEDAGAALVTHFSNGMSKLKDGEKTFATALLYETSIPLELIMDGHHVSPEDIASIASVAGNRIVFVTDAIAAAGQPDGEYLIGDLDVVVKDGVARLKSNGALAGSTLTMNQAVAHAQRCGVDQKVIDNATRGLPSSLLQKVL